MLQQENGKLRNNEIRKVVKYCKSSIKPPGGLFFSSTSEGGLNREGGIKERGGGLI